MRSRSEVESVPLHDSAQEAPAAAREGARVVQAGEPVPIAAWVVTGRGRPFLAETAVALAWTNGPFAQVRVRYIDPGGRAGVAWLWASAVRRDVRE